MWKIGSIGLTTGGTDGCPCEAVGERMYYNQSATQGSFGSNMSEIGTVTVSPVMAVMVKSPVTKSSPVNLI